MGISVLEQTRTTSEAFFLSSIAVLGDYFGVEGCFAGFCAEEYGPKSNRRAFDSLPQRVRSLRMLLVGMV
jgi:hypothetical protein